MLSTLFVAPPSGLTMRVPVAGLMPGMARYHCPVPPFATVKVPPETSVLASLFTRPMALRNLVPTSLVCR